MSWLVWRSRILCRLFTRLRGYDDVFRRDYDLLIEGFPRSGNTFAAKAFRYMQGGAGKVAVASHYHNPLAVTHAVQLRKPVLLLIRRPLDAIVSWCIFTRFPPEFVGQRYLDYYRLVAPVRDRVVVADFSQVTRNFHEVVAMVNERTGSRFSWAPLTSHETKLLLQSVDDDYHDRRGYINESKVSRPSEKRAEMKARLTAEIESRHRGLLEEANELYAGISGPNRGLASAAERSEPA